MSHKTTRELFELAIAAEKATESLYLGMAKLFAAYPDVAEFWEKYAAEEVMHAKWLRRIRDTASPERLAEDADPTQLENAHRALQMSVEHALAGINNLEEAYQLANDVENSETNAVFEFLVTHFSEDKKVQAFLRSQLREHVGRLMISFPAQFKHAAYRREVKAAHPAQPLP